MPSLSFVRLSLVTAMVVGSLSPLAARAAVPSGSLIKGATNPAVYYVEAGKRYSFPNEAIFKGWYADFSTVVTVPDAELASFTLAGNVTYRPGSRLVKITTDPKVYAVSRYGVLRWVMNESAAAQIYGSDWNKKVDDIADTFFINYIVGSSIGVGVDYNLNEEASVNTISQNIRTNGYTAPVLPTTPPPASPTAGTAVVSVSTSQATLNQMVLVVATITGNDRPISKLELYVDQQTAPLKTCQSSSTCSFMYTVTQAPLIARFKATATNDQNVKIETPLELQGVLNVSAVSTDIMISASPFNIPAGERVNYASNASKFVNITSHQVFITIPGEPNPVLWRDCGANAHCASSSPLYRTSQFLSRVTVGGQTYQSASVTVNVTSGTPPKPTLTLLSKPQPNQAVIRLDAPSGETIGWSSIVEGSDPDNMAIAICDLSSCELTLQFSMTTTYTGFTAVGGKLEASNSITVSP